MRRKSIYSARPAVNAAATLAAALLRFTFQAGARSRYFWLLVKQRWSEDSAHSVGAREMNERPASVGSF